MVTACFVEVNKLTITKWKFTYFRHYPTKVSLFRDLAGYQIKNQWAIFARFCEEINFNWLCILTFLLKQINGLSDIENDQRLQAWHLIQKIIIITIKIEIKILTCKLPKSMKICSQIESRSCKKVYLFSHFNKK